MLDGHRQLRRMVYQLRPGRLSNDVLQWGRRDPLTGEGQFTIVMSNGISINLSVRQWQTDVNAWIQFFGPCGPALAVDGGFGARSTAATVCIQGANGLQANGDVGRITLGAMCADLTTAGRIDLRNNTNCTQ
jgi:hypothetical protein